MTDTRLFKFLAAGRRSPLGTGVWTPGRPRSVRGKLVPCRHGIHYCRAEHLPYHVKLGPELWLFEDMSPGEAFEHETNKMVTRKGMIVTRFEAWTPGAIAQWADDCTQHIAHLRMPAPRTRVAREAWAASASAAWEARAASAW